MSNKSNSIEVFDVRKFGGTQADIGIGVGAALSSATTVGGSTVHIPFPRDGGVWNWVSFVSTDFLASNGPAYISLEGNGAVIKMQLPSLDKGHHMCLLQNENARGRICNLTVIGDPPSGSGLDAASAFYLSGKSWEAENMSFWGIRTESLDTGALGIDAVHARVSNMQFHGCCAAAVSDCGVLVVGAQESVIENVRFDDFDSFLGVSYSKTIGANKAWILLSGHVADPLPGQHPVGSTIIRDCFFDEVALQGQVWIKAAGFHQPSFDHIKLERCYFNCPTPGSGDGIRVDSPVRSLVLEEVTFTYQAAFGGVRAMRLAAQVDHLKLERCHAQGWDTTSISATPKSIVFTTAPLLFEMIECQGPSNYLGQTFALDTSAAGSIPVQGFITIEGERVEMPSNITGLTAWWKSDTGLTRDITTGNLSQVADQSGNGHHLNQLTTTKQPSLTLNSAAFSGYPAITHDGVDDFLATTAFTLGTFTVFMVSTGLSVAGKYFWTRGAVQDYLFGATPAIFAGNRNGTGSSTWNENGTWGAFGSTPKTIRVSMDGTHAGHVAFMNGTQFATTNGVSTGDPGTGTTNDIFAIGADSAGATAGAFSWAEVIVFNRALTTEECSRVEAYLRAKYRHYARQPVGGSGGPTVVGGDLTGTTNNATVVALQTHAVGAGVPSTGDLLRWNGSAWTPTSFPNTAPFVYNELVLDANAVSNTTTTPQRAASRIVLTSRYASTLGALNRTVRFKATLETTAGTAHVDLYNETDAETVTGTSLTTTNAGPSEVSATLTLGAAAGNLKDNKMYSVRVWITGGGGTDAATLSNARLEVTYE
jgi:hypothetical protein